MYRNRIHYRLYLLPEHCDNRMVEINFLYWREQDRWLRMPEDREVPQKTFYRCGMSFSECGNLSPQQVENPSNQSDDAGIEHDALVVYIADH